MLWQYKNFLGNNFGKLATIGTKFYSETSAQLAGCRYVPPGPWLLSQPKRLPPWLVPIILLG